MSVPAGSTDVFVIGGGPAGLAAAIAARLQGLEVTVADAAHPSIDKACGEGLMPDSLAAMDQLGIAPGVEQCYPLRGVRFFGAGVSVASRFPEKAGVGIRRVQLHQLLANRAAELGVRMLWGTRVSDAQAVRSRWIIGADGQNSRVRQWAGLQAARHESFRYGFRRHYRIAPWSDHIEIHWGTGCQIYVTPVSPNEVCIALLCRDAHLRLVSALPQFPELQRKLAVAEFSSTERGAITASRRLRRVYRDNTVLIGDASGSVDAIAGDGLCLSLQQATALAVSLASGDLSAYQAEHRRLERRPVLMARLMLSLDRFPTIRPRALRAMAREPAIFANLLAMHVGSLSSTDFLFHGMLPLGRQMLTVS